MGTLTRRSLLKSGLAAVGAGTVAMMGRPSSAEAATTQKVGKAQTFDAVIVGAGCAGLACAIEVHDQGGKPVVLEKMGRPSGNAIFALGSVCVTGTRLQKEQGIDDDSVEQFYQDMMKVSLQRGDPELTRFYAENSAEAFHWLVDKIGVKFKKIIKAPYPRFGRIHRIDGEGITGGGMLIRKLLAAAKARGIPVLYHTKAVELLTNLKMEVTGVRALTPEGLKDFNAKGGVLIASGGFSANREMLTMYMGGWAANLATRGSPYVTGENIALTKPLYAQLVHMDQFHGGPIVAATHVNPADILNAGYGIIVSMQGQRVIDEASTYVAKAKTLPRVTKENRAFQICDSNSKNPQLAGMIKKYTHLNSPFYQAETLEELAKLTDIPAEALIKTVNEYNDALKNNAPAQLNPPNTLKTPYAVETAPYYAFPFEGGMTATFGGPKINVRAEVVNTEQQTIPGLYAAGNAAGGLFYNDYIGGCQLGGATIFGRVAAKEMVARSKKA
ncbi:MAG: FAD-dependent oxidoreductase [Burkholderiales bacterium]|jgi:fumarate reductase flavoprotein subunit|nr:FAD-dependent oxidoreductase [Burkholderiales bacterium]